MLWWMKRRSLFLVRDKIDVHPSPRQVEINQNTNLLADIIPYFR
ncbi:hypothetical protein COO91_08487 [Nostoc flagelliforme CCNUN1]|uniref:Uncharacterized protein n=1 Tax=Nostoc flagelliforme CCNUN1 TaxID=2038116 RepID=A0A2K8T3T3_9NOSO|nr:hypothetical protein COO91_08487 [Nostoc flagelliforme CCNUN1]